MLRSRRMFLVHAMFNFLPPTRLFGLKSALLRWAGAEVGRNVRIVSSARFLVTGPLIIGEGTWIGHEAMIVGGAATVKIGASVDLGPRAMLVTGSHELFGAPGKAAGDGYSSAIEIHDGAWIGAAAVVLGGITIGQRAMVAAGALVSRDVRSGVVVAGTPARELER